MSAKLVIAVTDRVWYQSLRAQPDLTEVNFWSPTTKRFRALNPGELFLFRVGKPVDAIVGGGIFCHETHCPLTLAWSAFGVANGRPDVEAFREAIARFSRGRGRDGMDPIIACRVLSQVFFFRNPIPWTEWAQNWMTYRTYDTAEESGRRVWDAVQSRLQEESLAPEIVAGGHAAPQLITPRLGQGAFRLMVTDHYGRRCAVSGERTLPALDAAHIRPYKDVQTHDVRNGLLLRSDIHRLFDTGYVTITPDARFEVSDKVREEFENGRAYYQHHGQKVSLPENDRARPDREALRWHNDNRFRA